MTLLVWIGLALGATPAPEVGLSRPTLPTPFHAEQIREGMPVGLVIAWCPSLQGETTTAMTWEVTARDAATVTLAHRVTRAADGLLLAEGEQTFPFEVLRSHAVFPVGLASRRHHDALTTRVGDGPGWVYEVREGDVLRRYTFLDAFPGAPVLVTAWQGDEQLLGERMEQCRRAPPTR